MELIDQEIIFKNGERGTIINQEGTKITVEFEQKQNIFDLKNLYESKSFKMKEDYLNDEINMYFLYKDKIQGRTYFDSKKIFHIYTELDFVKSKYLLTYTKCDTNAQNFYNKCCDYFLWDEDKQGHFAPSHKLYANNATAEGYGVWFIFYSNLNKDNVSYENWQNEISGKDYDTIIEYWEQDIDILSLGGKNEKRITFVKIKNNKDHIYYYYFFGVYKCIEINTEKSYKKYKRVSNIYIPLLNLEE